MLLQVFINTELYARVSVAALFHQLWKQIKEKSKLETEETLQCGKLFLLKLLDSAVLFSDLIFSYGPGFSILCNAASSFIYAVIVSYYSTTGMVIPCQSLWMPVYI